jgi:hypothetical protein
LARRSVPEAVCTRRRPLQQQIDVLEQELPAFFEGDVVSEASAGALPVERSMDCEARRGRRARRSRACPVRRDDDSATAPRNRRIQTRESRRSRPRRSISDQYELPVYDCAAVRPCTAKRGRAGVSRRAGRDPAR